MTPAAAPVMMRTGLFWNISVPISSAVSIPSRVIISTVKRKNTDPGFRAQLQRRSFEVRFDFAFQALAVAPHVNDQRGDEHCGDQRKDPFPQRLVAGA